MYNLHGKNYIFTLQPTCHPIVPLACFSVASKTKKNILITLKVGLRQGNLTAWPRDQLITCCSAASPPAVCLPAPRRAL